MKFKLQWLERKFLITWPQSFVYLASVAASTLQQSRITAIATVKPTKCNIFTSWSSTAKACWCMYQQTLATSRIFSRCPSFPVFKKDNALPSLPRQPDNKSNTHGTPFKCTAVGNSRGMEVVQRLERPSHPTCYLSCRTPCTGGDQSGEFPVFQCKLS